MLRDSTVAAVALVRTRLRVLSLATITMTKSILVYTLFP